MSQFDFKEFVKNLIHEEMDEAGYPGQGHTSGAESFYGTYYGFGGAKQLAGELAPSVKRLKKRRDREAVYNIEDQMKLGQGYPAPQSKSGYPGGESRSGIRSGARIPNSINQVALSADELDKLDIDDPTKDYWGFDEEPDVPLDEEEPTDDILGDITEALGAGGGAQGPQRGVPSDSNYRDLPGYPRHNTIEKPVDYIPSVQNDEDGDGEEDVYLTDEEYVNDILRYNGINVRPGHKKKLFGPELGEAKICEKTLYHGTVNDHLDDIQQIGLVGDLGDFVKDAYGMELDEEDWENQLGNIVFAAEKSELDKAVGAMRYHIGKKLDKWLTDVDLDDLRRHGMLVIIRDIEEPEEPKYPEDVEAMEGEWIRRSPDDENYRGQHPMSVEPGDWYLKSEGGAIIDDVLIGKKMIQFLRRMGALQHVEEDMRRKLIKLMVAVHGPKEREIIVAKAKSMPIDDVRTHLREYEEEGSKILAKKKEERSKGRQSPQLSLNFEKKFSLKNVFRETYVAPSYGPEPDRGTERYKRGDWNRFDEPGATKLLIKHVDYTGGHENMPAADETPTQQYGTVGWPKQFVPDDWEQRHPKTRSDNDDRTMNEDEIKKVIRELVREAIQEAYTGIHGTEKDEPKGGSAAFQKSREKVISYDKKHRPSGIEDLENYHLDEK